MIDKIGHFFTSNGTDCYKMISFCEMPTIAMQNMETGEKVTQTLIDVKRKFIELVPAREQTPDANAVQRPDEQWLMQSKARTWPKEPEKA